MPNSMVKKEKNFMINIFSLIISLYPGAKVAPPLQDFFNFIKVQISRKNDFFLLKNALKVAPPLQEF
jgi:hypothetical protein